MSLGPPQRKPGELRPHVAGCVRGTQRGQPAVVQVEWLVDSGSDVAAVWHSVGKNFDRMRIAASASPTTGQGAIGVYIGLEIEFPVDGRSDARVQRPIAIKSNDAGGNILSMAELSASDVEMIWNPRQRHGMLH